MFVNRIVLGVLAFWVIGSLTTGKPLDLPPSITVLIGMLVTGKVAQKFKEG